jgi:CheY-like chemotaxis protein
MRARRQTILIVEDDEDLRRLFRTALSMAGYDVVEAGDGLEALQRVDSAPPDLIILDLVLPRMSGLVVREEIAAQALTRDIPVVVITGAAIEPAGMEVACFLRKPVEPDRMVEAVRNCLASGTRGV